MPANSPTVGPSKQAADHEWPDLVELGFRAVTPNTPLENHWYGVYNTLLQYHFPWQKAFQIMPQQSVPSPLSPKPGMIDFTTIVWNITKKALRGGADDQMWARFRDLQDNVILPKLYGVSALGTRFSVYTFDEKTQEVTPPPLNKGSVVLYDYALASRWDYDLMEPAGRAKFAAIVEHTKKMCADAHKCSMKQHKA